MACLATNRPDNEAALSLAWQVEEIELNAWPALREIYLDGWILRFGGGVSRRANSANPLSQGSRGSDALIAACEGHYPRHGLPPLFRIVSLLDPEFDARLAARGYAAEGETLTLYGDIAGVPAASDPQVTLLTRPTPRWCAAMAILQGHSPAQARTYRRIVERIALPGRFALLADDDAPVALAYGLMQHGLLCYESVVTDRTRRRRGYSRRLLAALAAWAKAEGAPGACLQVQADNAPAVPLYHSIGLTTELYRYHYRRAPSG
ncbi:MAG TPA: GNAT family N-acetyltransferase [Stellaceae bacterium]|jgi:GNAT superfamily N-acetyltransferase|nr:GNAT family N-acetyltransferase [Stellaceae bacterium]